MTLHDRLHSTISYIEDHPRAAMWCTALFAVLYFLLVSLQGLDYADEGFSLAFYQNIFTHPSDIDYNFLYYLEGVIGGLWYMAFGGLGNYGFRILFALFMGATVLVSFAILRRYLTVTTVTLGCLACILWPGLCLYFFNRDCLTVLLFLLAVWALLRGIEGKAYWFYLSGFLLMINVFARIPNVLSFVLILLPIVDAFYSGRHLRAATSILRMLVGMVPGLVAMLGIMHLSGHGSIMWTALETLFVMGGDSTDNHSITNLLHNYAYTYKCVVTITIYGFLVGLFYVGTTQLIKVRGIRIIAGVISVVLLYGLLSRNEFGMWGAVTSGAVIYSLAHYKDSRQVLLGIVALVMLVVVPIGGDSYINICNSCMWLGMPLLVSLFRYPVKWDFSFRDSYGREWRVGLDVTGKRHLAVMAGVTFLVFVVLNTGCYFDLGSRFDKRFRPYEVPAVTTFTTRERADITSDAVRAIEAHRVPGDYLLVFDNAPMLHYLTGMKPYLGTAWSAFWGDRLFEERLSHSESSARQLPLIAVPRFYYKDLSPIDYFNAAETPDFAGKAEALARFMHRNAYKMVYDDPYITLYAPYDGIL